MLETIFYITGSIFFLLSISILAILIIYSVKILQKIVSIESEIKNTVVETKNKIASFSLGFAAVTNLLEKIIQIRDARSGKKSQKKDKKELRLYLNKYQNDPAKAGSRYFYGKQKRPQRIEDFRDSFVP